MFVDVIRLRAKGERLERAKLAQHAPIAGYLNVHQRFDHWARRDVYVATLTRGEFATTEQLLPTLDQVRIGKLTGNDFVLLGLEDLSHPQGVGSLSTGMVVPSATRARHDGLAI